MKSLLAAILLTAVPLAAQDGPDSYLSSPEQFRGQFARLRLELLYPKLVSDAAHDYGADRDGRLDGFLADSAPVLKNIRGLAAYLRAGLKDPRAVDGSPKWSEAWTRLDEELGRLQPIVAEGESLLDAPTAARVRDAAPPEDKPEFDSPDGLRLRRAQALAAHAAKLREALIRGSHGTGAASRVDDLALARPFPR